MLHGLSLTRKGRHHCRPLPAFSQTFPLRVIEKWRRPCWEGNRRRVSVTTPANRRQTEQTGSEQRQCGRLRRIDDHRIDHAIRAGRVDRDVRGYQRVVVLAGAHQSIFSAGVVRPRVARQQRDLEPKNDRPGEKRRGRCRRDRSVVEAEKAPTAIAPQ